MSRISRRRMVVSSVFASSCAFGMMFQKETYFNAVADVFLNSITTNTNYSGVYSDATFISTYRRVRGLNIPEPFAYWEPNIPWNPRKGWEDWLPSVRLASIASVGFEFLRICVDPIPMLTAATESDLDATIATVIRAIETVLAVGLKAIFDLHPNPDNPTWKLHTMTDGSAGPFFKRLVAVETRIAAELAARFSPYSVAFELFNEPPFSSTSSGKTAWPLQLKLLYDAVRTVAPNMTLLVAGADLASADGLIALDASQFDKNTIFVFHFYEPEIFTFQGLNIGRFKYFRRLPFPPQNGNFITALKAVMELVNSDDNLSPIQKFATTKIVIADLDGYFSVPSDAVYIGSRFDRVAKWADRSAVDRDRIMCGEFGSFGDIAGRIGAALPDRVKWTRTVRQAAEICGFNWCIHDLDESFRITNDDGTFIPDLLIALDLRAS